jgi:hypothetical protein
MTIGWMNTVHVYSAFSESHSMSRLDPHLHLFTIYSCDKQVIRQKIAEQFGVTSKTVNIDLEARLNKAHEDHRDCQTLAAVTKQLMHHTTVFTQSQTAAAAAFDRLSRRVAPLRDEFVSEHKLFDSIANNALVIVSALSTFNDELVGYTTHYELLWRAVAHYQAVRVEFDVCRLDLERNRSAPVPRVLELERNFHDSQARFDKICAELSESLARLEVGKVRNEWPL